MAKIVLILVATAFVVQASEIVPPLGWRMPVEEDFTSPERVSLINTQVAADFNGDGIDDCVLTLFRDDSGLAGLFVILSNTSEHLSPKQINRKPMYRDKGEYHLRPIKPGRYTTPYGFLDFKYWGFAREEIEYGYGTMYWLSNGQWKYMFFARGDINGVK